jgi:hypothetical protein
MSARVQVMNIADDLKNRVYKSSNKVYSNLELCRIEQVDTKNKVVSAYFFDSKKMHNQVPYCYPFYNGNGTGIIAVPMKGALGIAGWDASSSPIILTFTAPATTTEIDRMSRDIPQLENYNLPNLLEGEIMIISSGHSFVHFDSLGGVTLSSSLLAYIKLDENGNYKLDCENTTIKINGISEEIYQEDYIPKFKITKGKHTFYPTQQSDNAVELYYRLSILNDGIETDFLGIGSDGKIHTNMDIIKYSKE